MENLSGSWALYDVESKGHDKDGQANELANLAKMKRMIADGQVLSFFPDSTFSELGGAKAYAHGHWRFNERKQQLLLQYNDGSERVVSVETVADKKARIMLTDRNIVRSYLQTTTPLSSYQEDPYHPSNNGWRIRPDSSENSRQLQARLGGYFRHLIYLLQAAKSRKQDVVSFEFSQGPVKIYDGGIGIHPLHIVPRKWTETYYNKQDALKAYRMYEHYLATNSYRGAATGEWVVDDRNILLSIYADLEEGRFPVAD
ncbi:hypothetical protein EPD60_00920 [Flaviaesturariibacter flavus]|uniref:Uncharacterized protein n=1 Tax=Flaviaesturariibacter flavus TaxID=2502780 RepID=A0A4R1BNN1_9BACT|nr:hypothetical protein [Flaviaesturariibacter flavus]TCJ19008.1 hypothetical protein EPD60_00920 [Flaviaesturariibacter flavus]